MPVIYNAVNRAAYVDLVMQQGSDFNHVVSVTDNDGSIFVLTGYTARMQVRSAVASATVLSELSTANGMITVNALAGQLTLSIPNAVTSTYTWRSGVYDLEIISAGGVVTRIMEGNMTLSLEVTR